MVLEFFFGVALLVVVVYIIFRIMGSIALGVLLVLIVFLASYLLVGSFPSLSNIPVIGQFVPRTTGDAIAVIKDVVHSVDIIGISNSSEGNLLVTVVNTGKLELFNFTAYVDNQEVKILNNVDVLKSKEVIVFELEWKDSFEIIEIKTLQTEAKFKS